MLYELTIFISYKVLAEDTVVNKKNDVLQNKFNSINEERKVLHENSDNNHQEYVDLYSKYSKISEKRAHIRASRYYFS